MPIFVALLSEADTFLCFIKLPGFVGKPGEATFNLVFNLELKVEQSDEPFAEERSIAP